MAEGIFIQWEVLTGIGIPSIIAAIGMVKFFHKKEKCFTEMKHKIDSLTRHDNSANDIHNTLEKRILELEDNQKSFGAKQELQAGYMRLILDHLKIPYPKK